MEKRSTYRIAVTSVGCVLGAGFVSGKEMATFFASFGAVGLLGLLLAVFLFFLSVYTVLRLASERDEVLIERLVVPMEWHVARRAVLVFETVLLLSVYMLMVAAAGALTEAVFRVPVLLGSGIFCAVSTASSFLGIKGLVRAFGVLVPVLVFFAAVVGVIALFLPRGAEAPMFYDGGGWAVSAAFYVSFNVVGSIPVIAAVGKGATSRAIWRGAALAALLLFLVGTVLTLALLFHPAVMDEQLPLLRLAFSCGSFVGALYAALLFGGVFGTGLGTQTALLACFSALGCPRRAHLPILAVLSALSLLAAFYGFDTLVSLSYPLFGLLGFLPLMLVFLHLGFLFLRKRK